MAAGVFSSREECPPPTELIFYTFLHSAVIGFDVEYVLLLGWRNSCSYVVADFRFWHKADIALRFRDVR